MRERREVFGVDCSIVVEIPVIPHHAALAQVVRERREVFGVDGSVQVGVTQQGVRDFDLAGRQSGDLAIFSVGVTDAITETAGGVVRCDWLLMISGPPRL